MKHTRHYLEASILRKYSKYKRLLISLGVSLAVLSATFYIFENRSFRDHFSVKNIEIQGSLEFASSNDVLTVVKEASLGKTIILFDSNLLRRNLFATFLSLSDVTIKKRYPSTIVVYLNERKPVALVKTGSEDAVYLIDSAGFVLGEVGNLASNLPVYQTDTNLRVKAGTFLPEGVLSIAPKLVELLERENIQISSFSIKEDYILIRTRSGTDVFLSKDKDLGKSISILKDVTLKYNVENKAMRRIDLRYDNVVVE